MEDWRDLKANALRPRLVSMDTGAEAKEWLERRLEASVTEQRDQISRRFGAFEQADKHFKDWVQREHEQLHSQLQQLRVSVQETGQQQQRLVGNLTAQSQKQDMRLQELEGQMAQSVAQVQGLMNAVSAGAMNAGNGGGTGEAAMGAAAVAASASANLEVLRQGLEREASARVALGAETAEQLKQLSDMVYELSNRQQQQQVSAQQHLQQNAAQDEKDQARVVQRVQALEPSVSSMREELEELRKLLYRCGTDCAKRCEESEELCQKRLGGVQEAALNAARELWEEHQGVVVECKSSLAALQQILDSKDKIALQLRSLQQQQREEDKQEFWTQMQVRHEQLQAKLADTERALQTEQNVRIEEQQRAEGVVSRLGLALEKAQAAWLKDSAKLSEEIHEAKRDFSIEMDGETRGVARRLADGLEAQQRSIDELGRKINGQKTELTSVAERLDSSQRAQQQELRDAEGRMMRQLNDVQTIQSGRTQQAVFDMKAEMAKLEQVTAGRCSALQKSQDELEGRAMAAVNSLETRTLEKIQDTVELERDKTRLELQRALEEERLERRNADDELRAERDRHLEQMREQAAEAKQELLEVVQTAEERLLKRLDEQVASERSKTREQIEAFIEEERSERLKAEAERLMSLQKRLQAHEELTTERLNEQRARWETEIETVRQKLEAQALRDKQDLQKDLQEFVQEERLVTNALTEEMTTLAGDMQSLADSWQKHQRATEQRLATEFAALAAQQAVSSAALTAQLGRSEEAQKQRLEHVESETLGGIGGC
ncbi:Ankyrin-2 [Durusdinium trenchii]|uniref:Ankyrin-2 n=1 Tax=Durusdinium trenchii TaxID=1381693 RepID=A0ABP0PPQ3_9DINO